MANETHLYITSWEQYQELRDGIRDYEFWRNSRCSVKTSEVPPSLQWVDNRVRSAVEHWEFFHSAPSTYFAYVGKHPANSPTNDVYSVTTWTGQSLGYAFLGTPYSDNFGGKRQSIEFHAINGRKYHGTYYRSAGDYCRLKLAKRNRGGK